MNKSEIQHYAQLRRDKRKLQKQVFIGKLLLGFLIALDVIRMIRDYGIGL